MNEFKPTHRHRKTGGLYRVLAHGTLEATMEPVIIYQAAPLGGLRIWVRPKAEFDDGRFEPLPPTEERKQP